VAVPGGASEPSTTYWDVEADTEGGAWLAWFQDAAPRNTSVALHLTRDGQVDQSVFYAQYDITVDAPWNQPGLLATSSTEMWVAEVLAEEVRGYAIKDGALVGTQTVMSDPYHEQAQLYVDYSEAFEWRGQRWIWFKESRNNVLGTLHAVKILDGCTYLPATRPSVD
jgi:hypothetical protein